MRKRLPSVIALLCVIVYVLAVLSAAFRVYWGIQRQSAIARGDLEKLASVVAGDSLLDAGGGEQTKEQMEASRALEGIIITGSNGKIFHWERENGKTITQNGDNLSFTKRFGVIGLPAKQVDVPGLRNVNIYAVYSAVNYGLFISILKQTLIAVMCALLIAFLTMIIRYTMGDKASSARRTPSGKNALRGKPAPAPAMNNVQADIPGFNDFMEDSAGAAEEKPDSAEDTNMDDFGLADFAEEPENAPSAGADAAFNDDFNFDFGDDSSGAATEETAGGEDIPPIDDLFPDVEDDSAITDEAANGEDMPSIDNLFPDVEDDNAITDEAANGEDLPPIDNLFPDVEDDSAITDEAANSEDMPPIDDLFPDVEDDSAITDEAANSEDLSAIDDIFSGIEDIGAITEESASGEDLPPVEDDLFPDVESDNAITDETASAEDLSLVNDDFFPDVEGGGTITDEAASGEDLPLVEDDLFPDVEGGGAITEEAAGDELPSFDELETGASFAAPDEAGGKPAGNALPALAGVIPEEQIRNRLDSELERSAELGEDLTVMLLECGENVTCDEALYKKLAGEAKDFFNLDGLTFGKGERGISLIIPGGSLDSEMIRAGEFHSRVLKNIPGSFNEKTDLRIGLSSRSGRNVQSGRLLFEASNALKKAAEDQPIVAFRIDPEKYRQFILSHH